MTSRHRILAYCELRPVTAAVVLMRGAKWDKHGSPRSLAVIHSSEKNSASQKSKSIRSESGVAAGTPSKLEVVCPASAASLIRVDLVKCTRDDGCSDDMDDAENHSVVSSVLFASTLSHDVMLPSVAFPSATFSLSDSDALAIASNHAELEDASLTPRATLNRKIVDQNMLCAEDVLTSIKTKLALLDKTLHFDNSRKRVTGARAAKATASGSPRTTGKSHRVYEVAQVPWYPAAEGGTDACDVAAHGAAAKSLNVSPPIAPLCVDNVQATAAVDPALGNTGFNVATNSDSLGQSVDDNAASCAEDVLTSIKTKLALLDKTLHFDNSRKRVTGARAVKATASGSPRTTGKSHRVYEVAQVLELSSSDVKTTAALSISSALSSEPASSESLAVQNDASCAPTQQEVCSDNVQGHGGAGACSLSAANSSSVSISLPDAEACPSPPRDFSNTITSSNSPPMDLFSSIEAKLALLSSVVVPPQFKKRALGARRHPPAGQPTGTNSASPAPRVATLKATKHVPKRSDPPSKLLPEAVAVCHDAASAPGMVVAQEHTSTCIWTSTPEHGQRQGAPPSADAVAVGDMRAELYSTQGVPCESDPPDGVKSQLAVSISEADGNTSVGVVADDHDRDACAVPPLFPYASASEAQCEPSATDVASASAPPMCVRPFGLSLEKERGGAGYVVSAVAPASSASAESRLKKGVMVLELNGQSCKGMELQEVNAMLEGTGFTQLRVTVKKSWLWGTTTVVLKKLEQHDHAGVTQVREQNEADAGRCLTPSLGSAGQALRDLNLELDKELLARAAVAVASEHAVLNADSMNRGGAAEDGKEHDNGGVCCDDDRDGIEDGIAAGKIAEQGVKHQISEVRNSSNSGSCSRDEGFIETMAAVERNLQALSCNVHDFDKQRQQLRRRTVTTEARAHVAAARGLATPPTGHPGAVPVILGGGDEKNHDCLRGTGVESSVHEAMKSRFGDGLQACTAAAVAEAATSTDLRRKLAEEKAISDKAALAEVVARQSALTLEARAVVAGSTPPYIAFFC